MVSMMKLKSFQDWIQARESTAKTRLMRGIAMGQYPAASMGSFDGHSTLNPGLRKKVKKKAHKLVVKNDIWDIPEEERSPDYSFDKWLQSALEKSKELDDSKKAADEENEKLDKEIEARLKEKDKPEATDHPQESEEEEIGKEARWTGHKKEREDREKAGVGPTVGRKQS